MTEKILAALEEGEETEGSFVLMCPRQSPVRVESSGAVERPIAMIGEETPARPKLFFVLGSIQTTPIWILADSGSARNLIAESTFNKLPFQPPLTTKTDVHVIGGSGEELRIRGWTIIPVAFGAVLLWHEFSVVPNLPLEALIGGDVLAPHQC